jgi:predicted O-linked N-acetylglucosamine transferase (SPINDLY family)
MTPPAAGGSLIERALAMLRAGQLAEGERLLREVLRDEPNHPVALHQLGLLAHHFGHLDAAVDYISRAIAAAPDSPPLRSDLAFVLERLGRRDEAAKALRVASKLEPRNVQFLGRLALLLEQLNQSEESRACYERAEPLVRNDADALSGGAGALGRMGYIEDAMRWSRRALELKPGHAGASNNLGQGYALIGDVDEAINAFRVAVAGGLAPAWDNLLFHLHFHPACDAAAVYAEHRRWAASRSDPPPPSGVFAHVNRGPERRLRIGYVSADFRMHPVCRLFEPVLASHDRTGFEIVCYHTGVQNDAMTAAVRAQSAAWRDAAGADDALLTEQIRRDGIDVLVDLSSHMANNRLGVFARRAAPVQVTWLGYPGTTGLTTMDYRLSDPHLDPPGADEPRLYSERTVRLPHSFWPYRGPADGPPVNALPALERGHVTFASFNNPVKFNPAVFDAFARILSQVEGSRLLLLNNGGPAAAQRVVQPLVDRGVAPQRVEALDRALLRAYFEYHHRADVVLDPFPYPGHTTTLDALWMGVPVITLCGSPAAPATSRGGKSILTNVGLTELITHDVDTYIATAVALARDVDRLAGLRATLRQRFEQSPICDAAGFTRGLEDAYRTMWREWCEPMSSRAPRGI